MKHKLTQADLKYIKKHYSTHSNRQLAKDLKVDKILIVRAFDRLNLNRTRDKTTFRTSNTQEKSISVAIPILVKDSTFQKVACIVLFLLTFAVYANSFNNKFVWDDEILIVKNNYIKTTEHFPEFFTENLFKGGDRDSNFWRPTQLYSFFVDHTLYGLNPMGWHLTSTILHFLVVLMVFFTLYQVFPNRGICLVTAIIYALHPLHTEAVTYLAGRADSISFFFVLLSLYLYIRYTRSSNPRDIILYFGSFLSMLLGLMSKEMAIMTPAYFLLFDLTCWDKQKKARILKIFLRYSPFICAIVIYGFLRTSVLDFANIPLLQEQAANGIPTGLRFLTFTRTLYSYMMILILPNLGINLSHFNYQTLGGFGRAILPLIPDTKLHMERGTPYAQSYFQYPYFIFFIMFIAIILLIFFLYKRSKIGFFGLSWFMIGLGPFMDFIPLNANMSEHWLYIPSVGFLLLISTYLAKKARLRNSDTLSEFYHKLLFSPLVFIFIFLFVMTFMRNIDWRDDFTIWRETAAFSNSSHIHGNLGVAYGRKGDFVKSKEEFIRALRLQFNYPEAHNNLGVIMLMEGKIEDSIREFEFAIQFNPNYSNAYKNLGDAYLKQNKIADSKDMWQKALDINPYHDGARERLEHYAK